MAHVHSGQNGPYVQTSSLRPTYVLLSLMKHNLLVWIRLPPPISSQAPKNVGLDYCTTPKSSQCVVSRKRCTLYDARSQRDNQHPEPAARRSYHNERDNYISRQETRTAMNSNITTTIAQR